MKKIMITFVVALVAAILLFAATVQTMNIADVDAAKSSRGIACTNPRNTAEKDPKFCAHLIVVKNVQGGTASPSEFTIHVTGNNPSPSTFQGSSSGTTVTLGQGSYQVTETGKPADYTPTSSSDCSGSISAGQTKTCTITNTFTAPPQTATLTVITHVINDNGGTAQASDFTLTWFHHSKIDDQCTSGAPQQVFQGSEQGTTFTIPAGPSTCGYSVFEGIMLGYTTTYSNCFTGAAAGPVPASPGQTYTCTVTNTFTGTG